MPRNRRRERALVVRPAAGASCDNSRALGLTNDNGQPPNAL